jgi:glycosyltransferase involved in cell wall biosynthesis
LELSLGFGPLKSMRILAITNLYPNPYQPLRATFNREEFRALAKLHSLAVISPIAWTDELTCHGTRAASLPRDRRILVDGIAVDYPRYLFTPKILRAWYGHFYRFSVNSAFKRALAEFRPDLIYAHWAYPDGWAAVELGHAAGLPVVIKVHGSDILVLSSYRGRRHRTIEALQRADGIVAVSQDLAQRMVEMGARVENIHVVYAGIDREVFRPGSSAAARGRLGLEPDIPIILFVGNLLPVKGLDVLVEASFLLKKDGVKFSCLLIGQGPMRDRLERQIASLQLQEQVHMLGVKPNEELPEWYRAATLFVLPSRSEGLPTVLREAAACGTPFVASSVGGIPEIAHLVPSRLVQPEDARGLAHAIREMIERPINHKECLDHFRQFPSHDESAAELSEVLEAHLCIHRQRATHFGPFRSPSELAS